MLFSQILSDFFQEHFFSAPTIRKKNFFFRYDSKKKITDKNVRRSPWSWTSWFVRLRNIIRAARTGSRAVTVPFSESFNDHPSNGLALCKNHHWAMDRYLLAPTIERRWKVSPRMDSRILDFKEFLALDGRELFPPSDLKFSPSDNGLSWREAKLLN